jgi:hypothetical protein
MYVGRTSEIVNMTNFENFRQDLMDLVKKYDSDIPLKVEEDIENNIIKIFGANMTSLARAQNGLNDMTELAYTTAEHHPYWNLLYNCSEIANTVLDKWKNSLSSDDFKDIDWALKEIRQTLEKIKNNPNVSSHEH